MKLNGLIYELRKRWEVELKECRDALLDQPKAKPNPLDRAVVEYDYLLVEASRVIAKLEVEKKELLEILQNNLTQRKFTEVLKTKGKKKLSATQRSR